MNCSQKFHHNARALRQAAGLSAQDVSNMIGVKRSTYQNWETVATPPVSELTKICKLYGVTADDMLCKVVSLEQTKINFKLTVIYEKEPVS